MTYEIGQIPTYFDSKINYRGVGQCKSETKLNKISERWDFATFIIDGVHPSPMLLPLPFISYLPNLLAASIALHYWFDHTSILALILLVSSNTKIDNLLSSFVLIIWKYKTKFGLSSCLVSFLFPFLLSNQIDLD